MTYVDKTKEQLIGELQNAHRRITELAALQESQRLSEHEIRQNEKRYRLFAEDIADTIWILPARSPNQLIYISPFVARFLGYSVNELKAKTIEEVLTPESVQIVRKTLAEESSAERGEQRDLTKSRTLELEIIHRSGAVIPIGAIYCFLPGSENHPAEILVVARDIRVQKFTEGETEETFKNGAKLRKTS